jgi:SAM-dependent methyltransferase
MRGAARVRGVNPILRRRLALGRVAFINSAARTRAWIRNPRVVTRVAAKEDMLTGGPDLRLYFEVGESAMGEIRIGLRAAGAAEPQKILDLPCGYGRVLRYIRAAWPRAEITAMDLNPAAVGFCARTFRAVPVVSQQPLWLVSEAGTEYELLWCGSLLTHFDRGDWSPVLTYFRDRLAVGGTLVFTTHGDLSIDLLAGNPSAVSQLGAWVGDYGMGSKGAKMASDARSQGFAFGHYGDDTGPYGLSVSTPRWVREKVAEITGLEFVLHRPHGWFAHQDVWTYTRVNAR